MSETDTPQLIFTCFMAALMPLMMVIPYKMMTQEIDTVRTAEFCRAAFGENYEYQGTSGDRVICAEPGKDAISGVIL